ncbi:3064_t:CDS:2, partial [Scutellospora calospora]
IFDDLVRSSNDTESNLDTLSNQLLRVEVTEEESFIEILKKFNLYYKLPSRHYISSYVVKLFQNQQKDLNEDLQNISNRVILTTDIW